MNGRRHAFPLSRILSCRDQRNIRLAFDAENGMDSGNEERRREKEESRRRRRKENQEKLEITYVYIHIYVYIYRLINERGAKRRVFKFPPNFSLVFQVQRSVNFTYDVAFNTIQNTPPPILQIEPIHNNSSSHG